MRLSQEKKKKHPIRVPPMPKPPKRHKSKKDYDRKRAIDVEQ